MSRRNEQTAAAPVEGYVDIYLLPIPQDNVEAYRRQATLFGKVAREYGAISYREFRGDDLDHTLQVDFRSREHRDEVMAKVMGDARVAQLDDGAPLADMTRMRYGGFQTFVNV